MAETERMTWIWSRSWRKKGAGAGHKRTGSATLLAYVLQETSQKAAKLAKEYRKYRTVSSKTKNRPHIFKVKFRDLSLPTKLFFYSGTETASLEKTFLAAETAS